ncbi:MAG: ComEC family competence protein [Bacteroidales bacterium]|nr:ComEC family competence protein [Bacteroidales bacterium]
MNGYHVYTPVRIVMPFILGIICAMSFWPGLPAGIIVRITLVLYLSLVAAYVFLRTIFGLRWISGMIINLSLFLIGTGMISVAGQKFRARVAEGDTGSPWKIFLCRVETGPVRKADMTTGNVTVIAGQDSLGRWHAIDSKVLVYFKNDSLGQHLRYGDLLLVSGAMQEVAGPHNPHVFNYRRFLEYQRISHQVFLDPGHWKRIGKTIPNPVILWAESARKKFLEILKDFKVEGQDFALVSALLLGSKEFLESETIREFSQAGAIHVLSVSGLHVGIMYVVADKVLFFLKRGRKTRKLHHILIICFIWGYAFISGLPSSVIRAALMFSLLAVAKMFKRSSDNFNILAVAAFFQLWIDPYEIAKVGFQLSYLAVLGIFAFYKPLNELNSSGHRLISWIWPVLAVSIAAQLATFPLGCYYFNLFPVYFLLTNLVVVPLAAVITYFAVFLLFAGGAGVTMEWLAWPLKWSLRLMSGSVEMIQSWPGAVIDQVVLTRGQVILLYIALISMFIFFIKGRRRWAFVFFTSLLLISAISAKVLYNRITAREIIVYHVSGLSSIDFIHNREALFLCDSNLASYTTKIEFQVKPNRIQHGVREVHLFRPEMHAPVDFPGTWASYPFIYFMGQRVVIIDHRWKKPLSGTRIVCDLAIVSGKPQIKPDELNKQVDFRSLVNVTES